MNRRHLAVAAALAAFGLLAFTGIAAAASGSLTLGITALPTGGTVTAYTCNSTELMGQYADSPSTPYTVPTGGGAITRWQTNTIVDSPSTSMTFLVLGPAGVGYTVVGSDTETLPNPLPSSNTASFTLSKPMQVAAGDTLALYSPTTDVCQFGAASVPISDTVFGSTTAVLPPPDGTALTVNGGTSSGEELDVAATLSTSEDAQVQTSTVPATVAPGDTTVLSSSVTDGGPVVGPITFVDQVPAGLSIQSATAGLGTCSVAGQNVTCTISGLAAGQTVPVQVVVTASAAGTFTNIVNVSAPAGITDPVAANNLASASLTVSAPQQPQHCIVPGLRRVPAGSARLVLKELGCTVRVVRQHSTVGKGLVIGVRGKTGTYPYHQVVTLIVSSGRKPKRKKS